MIDASAGVDLKGLQDHDSKQKGADAHDDWLELHALYEDCARAQVQARLRELGVGIADNRRPIIISLLRRVIDRLATVYDRSPNRWLVNARGERLMDSHPDHRRMLTLLQRAQYDLAWRRVDRLRALLRQVGIRFYPSDERGSVVVRIFEPYNILRKPSPSTPDLLGSDSCFALRLQGDPKSESPASAREQLWEFWEKDADGWSMAWVDGSGQLTEEQPFRATGLRSPYKELPVHLIYDDAALGRAWLPARQSRVSWVDALNGLSNDLWALVVQQAHEQEVYKAPAGSAPLPSDRGPGTTVQIDDQATLERMGGNPKIKESSDVLESMMRLWALSEDLPDDEFHKGKSVLTGAALKVLERPLTARRAAQVPLASEDERWAFAKFRAVHNVHASAWGAKTLREDLDLEVELASPDQPIDEAEILKNGASSMALGTKSRIDVAQEQHGVSRAEALRLVERVDDDRKLYPPPVDPSKLQEGPRMAEVKEDETKDPAAPLINGPRGSKPSTIEAAKAA